ncbi:hypothetical protein [Kordia jejudonensis]|uniref:hypothetical protein n=1 Tax=Kordia jejudonensis TaxID=1348245 RepID=UPI000629C34F|nr:hypothetical protein [Kordia jejudonensis]
MKKRNLKNLKLNKKVISRVAADKNVKGGQVNSIDILLPPITLTCVLSVCGATDITRGDCDMPTIGHDDGSICISKDPDAWCGGR